jgi:hypothetical protein
MRVARGNVSSRSIASGPSDLVMAALVWPQGTRGQPVESDRSDPMNHSNALELHRAPLVLVTVHDQPGGVACDDEQEREHARCVALVGWAVERNDGSR